MVSQLSLLAIIWHAVCVYRRDINSTYDTHSQILLQCSASHSELLDLKATSPIIGFMVHKALSHSLFHLLFVTKL